MFCKQLAVPVFTSVQLTVSGCKNIVSGFNALLRTKLSVFFKKNVISVRSKLTNLVPKNVKQIQFLLAQTFLLERLQNQSRGFLS